MQGLKRSNSRTGRRAAARLAPTAGACHLADVEPALGVGVVAAGSRLVDAERKALNALVQAERGVRFVTVDASKYSLLADVPGGLPEPSAAASTLVLLKQVDGEGGAEAGGKRAVAAAVLAPRADASWWSPASSRPSR